MSDKETTANNKSIHLNKIRCNMNVIKKKKGKHEITV